MPARSAFEYAVVRVVPRSEREEFINVGVILLCRTRRFLDSSIELDTTRLAVLAPGLDIAAIAEQLGYIRLLPQFERFRWLVAPRSTIIQPSPVHCGMCEDPRAMLDHLLDRMVRPPRVPPRE